MGFMEKPSTLHAIESAIDPKESLFDELGMRLRNQMSLKMWHLRM